MKRAELLAKIRFETRMCLLKCRNMSMLRRLAFLSVVYTSIKSGIYRTVRGIYYDHANIFNTQHCIVNLIKLYTRRFGCERRELFIKASLKGVFEGIIAFNVIENNEEMLVRMSGKNLIPDMTTVVSLRHSFRRVLVIEKDSVFSALTGQGHMLICGKGYPCWNTLALLEMLEGTAEILCMTDYDPHGIDIFMVYRKRIPSMRRIGLCSSDLFRYNIDVSSCIGLREWDLKTIERLEKVPKLNDSIKEELKFMEGLGYKLELECLVWNERFRIDDYIYRNTGKHRENEQFECTQHSSYRQEMND
ncbi:meiotic recombination protein SPO11 [Pancytospora epiphaga]|nr:meiotic recombination protein SPO11 [Pancytospora epiphaga]